MAELLIALRPDPKTGKQNIIVKLEGDADALPMEHEQLHRKLVEKLLGAGLSAESLGSLVIERDAAAVTESDQKEAVVDRAAAKAGS